MSKYITKEEYIKAIEDQKEWWIKSARTDAEMIAERIKMIHPRAFWLEFAIPNRDNDKNQLDLVKNNLSEILPFLDFSFTPIELFKDATKYLVRWKLKEEEENTNDQH